MHTHTRTHTRTHTATSSNTHRKRSRRQPPRPPRHNDHDKKELFSLPFNASSEFSFHRVSNEYSSNCFRLCVEKFLTESLRKGKQNTSIGI